MEPRSFYRQRLAELEAEESGLAASSAALSRVRLVVFLLTAVVGTATTFGWLALPIGFGIACTILGLLVFAWLVRRHDRVLKAERRAKVLASRQRQGLARIGRIWDELELPPFAPPPGAPSFARDLDLFGRASLFHLLGPLTTAFGRETLARWLLEPAAPASIRERQEAVQELARATAFREDLALAGHELSGRGDDPRPFLGWAEGEGVLVRRPWLRWLAFLVPGLLLGATIAAVAGLVPGQVPLLLLVASFVVSFYLVVPAIHPMFGLVAARERRFASYARLLEVVVAIPGEAPALARLRDELAATGLAAHREMARLHQLVELADLRFSSLHFLIQAVSFWDVYVAAALERWQARAGKEVRGWLAALGEAEALAAFASLRFDHPEWTFPLVEAGRAELVARQLGHPLLASEAAVANDVTVGPVGTFLLVTGSNMSGKSTLLRALGTNLVLAQAGAPVAARELVLPPLRLATSIEVEDNLAAGASLFYAELTRLRSIVDASRTGEDTPLFFILDEILRGTNSAERHLAVAKVLRFLLGQRAFGAVSTHDLALAEVPEIARAALKVHFRETLEQTADGARMSFDYRLRPGLATTTNALTLLALMGLDPDAPG